MATKNCPGCNKRFEKDEPYPDVSMCEVCERHGPPKNESDELLKGILKKIDEGTVTCDDFNRLIQETTPESIRDRIRRRTVKNATSSHIDKDGHQQLKLPEFKKRIAPKRKPEHQQNHGRSKIAHAHSARTQRRTMPGKFDEEIQFIAYNIGKNLSECDLSNINRRQLLLVSRKMMALPNINRDWLLDLCSHIGVKHG